MAEKNKSDKSVEVAGQVASKSSLDRFIEDVGVAVVPVHSDDGRIEEERRRDVEDGVAELLSVISQNSAHVQDGRALETIRDAIAAIDEKLGQQVKEILHHEEFRRVEGAWRGIKYLVDQTPTSSKLKLKILNVPKEEVLDDLEETRGRWQHSKLFQHVYKEDYDKWGGEPFGALVGDFYFDQTQESLDSLSDIAKVCASAHAPFITSMSERFFGKREWSDVQDSIPDISSHLQGKEYAAWRDFREKDDSKYVGLTLPKVLARRPYQQSGEGADGGFAFDESEAGNQAAEYVWMNAAYTMAANINKSFADYGWSTAIRGIESGGAVDDLPLHTFETEDGSMDARCPTDISIGDTLETALSDNGFLALVHKKNSTKAAFIGGQSAYKAKTYATDSAATESEKLAARLPYNFAVSRISHYLKAIGRQMIGQGIEQQEIESKLNDWISQYVLSNPQDAPPSARAKQPLKDAKISVSPIEGSPGSYNVGVRVRPHYQIEDLNVDVTLVAAVEK